MRERRQEVWHLGKNGETARILVCPGTNWAEVLRTDPTARVMMLERGGSGVLFVVDEEPALTTYDASGHTVHWFGGPPPATTAGSFMDQPLPTAVPSSWAGKEDRVRWVLEHFTPGELALVYKLAHDVHKVRLDACDAIIRKEKT